MALDRTGVTQEFFCVLQLLFTVSVVYSSLILSTLMMEAICSSDPAVLTKATRCRIPEEGTRHKRDEALRGAIGCHVGTSQIALPFPCLSSVGLSKQEDDQGGFTCLAPYLVCHPVRN
jgi:hypothetical protein